MIAYRVEIWCDGCHVLYAKGYPFQLVAEAAGSREALATRAKAARWIQDGAAHFCPACQCQRAAGPIVDVLAISGGSQ